MTETARADQPRILVVDDEEHITEMLAMGLGYQGFEVERAATGRAALDAVVRDAPQLIILDVMLPDLDGFEVAKRLRRDEGAGTRIPIIFLTARDTTQDKVSGLRLGSDDYVTKPFSIDELLARLRAATRRASTAEPPAIVSVGDVQVDLDAKTATKADGERLHLTPTEWRLLETLLRQPGKLVTGRNLLT